MSARNYFTADAISYSDYYTFGMLMPNRYGQEFPTRVIPNVSGRGERINVNDSKKRSWIFYLYSFETNKEGGHSLQTSASGVKL